MLFLESDNVPAEGLELNGELSAVDCGNGIVVGYDSDIVKIVFGFLVIAIHRDEFAGLIAAEIQKVNVKNNVFVKALIDAENCHFFIFFVIGSDGFDVRNIGECLAVIFGAVNERKKSRASAEVGHMHKGEECCLFKNAAARFGEDGGDNINELSDAGNLDSVAMAEEGDEKRAYEKSVFEVIDIFKKSRSFAPFFEFCVV